MGINWPWIWRGESLVRSPAGYSSAELTVPIMGSPADTPGRAAAQSQTPSGDPRSCSYHHGTHAGLSAPNPGFPWGSDTPLWPKLRLTAAGHAKAMVQGRRCEGNGARAMVQASPGFPGIFQPPAPRA